MLDKNRNHLHARLPSTHCTPAPIGGCTKPGPPVYYEGREVEVGKMDAVIIRNKCILHLFLFYFLDKHDYESAVRRLLQALSSVQTKAVAAFLTLPDPLMYAKGMSALFQRPNSANSAGVAPALAAATAAPRRAECVAYFDGSNPTAVIKSLIPLFAVPDETCSFALAYWMPFALPILQERNPVEPDSSQISFKNANMNAPGL
jgi:hypothetical protein